MREIDYIIKEIDELPPKVLQEVVDYINYVKYKYKINDLPMKVNDITLASEKCLAREWLKPSEDDTWKHL